jgi:hypothetical protein
MLVLVRMLLALAAAVSVSGTGLALPTLGGKKVDPFRHRGTKAVVFVFTRTDCPISNRYAPEVERLYEKFRGEVDFWLVFVDRAEPAAAIGRHVREYGYRFGAILDRKHELVKLSQATVTPEAAVFAGERLIYRGRIDDRYIAYGKARLVPARHDLEEVLDAVAAGRPVDARTTRAIGCFIEDLE